VVEGIKELAEKADPLSTSAPYSYEEKREVDTAEDRVLSGINNDCDLTIISYNQKVVPLDDEMEAEYRAARTITESLLADGIGFIRGRWFAQFGHVSILLTRAKNPKVREAIRIMGLNATFRLLGALHKIYGLRMGFTQPETEALTALGDWHESLDHYLSTVCSKHRAGSKLRALLLKPYDDAVAEIRASRRTRTTRRPDEKTTTDEKTAEAETAPVEGSDDK